MDRRELLKTTLLGSVGCIVDLPGARAMDRDDAGSPVVHPEYARTEIPFFQVMPYEGEFYEDTVPDTLDLQERAKLAIHGITSITDAKCDYEIFWLADFFRNPPVMLHDFSDWCQNVEGIMEVLPLLRVATGSQLNSQVDAVWMRTMLESLGSDGLCYIPLNGRPWGRINTAGVDPVWKPDASATWTGDAHVSQVANGCTSQRAISTMTVYYLRDGNPMWKVAIEKMVDRLSALTIEREDYCYFPEGSFEENAKINPLADMPLGSLWGCSWNSRVVQGLSQYYRVTGYEPAKELASKLARYTRYHAQIFDAQGRWMLDPEVKGRRLYSGMGGNYNVDGLQFGGHGHGHGIALLSLFEYADAVRDQELQQYCKSVFEWTMNPGPEYGVSQTVGWFPEWFLPGYEASESCINGDMLALAIKLSRSGTGDYWDDIDRWLRNHFTEAQLIDPESVYRLSSEQPSREVKENETADHVPERSVGVYAGWATPNEWAAWVGIQHCCTGNAPRALFYAWNGMIEHKNDQLRIHLLMNRASRWADLYSYIPYEGRVDLKMKQGSKSVSLRAPEWVESHSHQLVCRVEGKIRPVIWDGRYVEVRNLREGDKLTMTFPISTRTMREKIGPKTYTLGVKGNTVISIDPAGKRMPLYLDRAKYEKSDTTPRKKVQRFVSASDLEW